MKKFFFPLLFILTLLAQSCTPSPEVTATSTIPPVNATQAQVATEVPPLVVTETAVAPTVASITHADIPTDSSSDRAIAHDQDNAFTFENKTARSGDEFFRNQFERPFTANDMAYLPDLDIVNFSITTGDKFYYVKISFAALNAATQSLTGAYGLEIDRNADGRAELLIATKPPYTNEFTADNVVVYMDMNGDVGGNKINRPDGPAGDGFETVIYDLHLNVYPDGDPDFAWVRQTQDGSLPAVEIAFKNWIFNDGRASFMWNADASAAALNPSIMYYQDHFTAEEAGSATKDNPNYPIKGLAGMDNTCRVPQGFDALGIEPFGCFALGSEKEIQSTPSADSTCLQFVDLCKRVQGRTIPYVASQ